MTALRGPFVGVSAIVVRDGLILMGRRRGSHGAGSWSPAGGKVDPGESPADAVVRELLEETGLIATSVEPIGWTSEVFAADRLHFVTLHHLVRAEGRPVVTEPDKVSEWLWLDWNALPAELFAPIVSLRATGWRPPSS